MGFFSKHQRGILGWLHGKLHPWFAGVFCGMEFLCSLSMLKKYQGEKIWQDVKGLAQPESSLQLNPQCFLPFWGSFLHLFNPSSPFGLQHSSNRKSCFEIKKPKKCFVLKKC